MKIKLEQLKQQLQQSLKPIYIVTGDEPLLVDETSRYIRKIAKQQGFNEHELIQVTAIFNWDKLLYSQQALSLFSEKSILELNLLNGQPNKVGKASLLAYAHNPPTEKLLLLRLPKLAATVQKSRWFTELATIGVVIPIHRVTTEQFPIWVKRYLSRAKLRTSTAGIAMLTDLSAGNLLAIKQTTEKLSLLYGAGELSVTQIEACLNDNTYYYVYDLLDTILILNIKRSISILHKLKATGTEATLILWVLTKEIRTLAQLAQAAVNGATWQQLCQKYGIWQRRQSLLKKHLHTMKYHHYLQLLQLAAQCDRVIKGITSGNIWQALEQLVLRMCNTSILAP